MPSWTWCVRPRARALLSARRCYGCSASSATTPKRGPAPRRTIAETGLREQIAELVQGWALADPNPDGYATALKKMSQAAPTLVTAQEARFIPEPERIVQMACESGAAGPPVTRAVDDLLVAGRLGTVLEFLQREI